MALLTMTPPCGERVLRYVGDSVEFELRHPSGAGGDVRFERAFLRTNVGRASRLREETIQTRSGAVAGLGGFWRDVPMIRTEWGWRLRLTLAEVGFFESKAYAVDEVGRQHWPEGANHGIAVHPDALRTGNTIYCAFVRLFGETRAMRTTQDEALAERVQGLDRLGYSVIPRSGTLRDLKGQLPHIFQTLKCRYLHLLPIQPTPTTFARFGRFGSPYACKELTDVDAALAEFDKRTTAIDQFVELADAVHGFGGKLLLDMVINHTGWNSALQERHPEWFVREADGRFASPGAWGTIWEDLVELHPWHHELWDTLADAFLTWCRRGVDGFRCDAGYKVPAPVWQYIVARVREEFADTVFLLEGLGGGWGDTERLLTTGGMQWAYSELFQEYSGTQVAGYLAHSLRQSERVGTLVHYSETHDNLRLAARGREWSLLRNQLSALTSSSGAFGFTCGVEWLAEEKINVHQCGGLSWGAAEHIVDELAQLNLLLAGHPCFFDGAKLTRLSDGVSSIYALMRTSADGQHRALVLVNLDLAHPSSLMLRDADLGESKEEICELVRSGGTWRCDEVEGGRHFHLAGGLALCLRVGGEAVDGDMGERYRADRSRAAFAIQALSTRLEPEHMGSPNWRALSRYVLADVETFLASLAHVEPGEAVNDLMGALDAAVKRTSYRRVIGWGVGDVGKVTLVPPGHWLLIRAETAFRAVIEVGNGARQWHYESIPVASGHVVAVPPDSVKGDARLVVQRYEVEPTRFKATIRFLNAGLSEASPAMRSAGEIVLLTNGIGGMARIPADFGGVRSKYDCLLGANLHPSVPVDRHVFVKRIRLWAMVNGFLTQLDPSNLSEFDRLHGARWVFHPHGGDGLRVGIWVTVEMVPGRNTTVIRLGRVEVETVGGDTAGGLDSGKRIGAWKPTPVSVTARLDIEDRSFHSQTKRNGGAEVHFAHHTSKLEGRVGFSFRPSVDRGLTVYSDIGVYHSGEEWSVGVPHPVEQTRGQEGFGDAYSPGWFELPLRGEEVASIVATAEPDGVGGWVGSAARLASTVKVCAVAGFEARLVRALDAFVVRRGAGKTVIAGYPWFLDWGRDTFIAARGLIASGRHAEVSDLLVVFGRFVDRGTLPNSIHGEDASNRDTSDASLWYAVVCEELAEAMAGLGEASDGARGGSLFERVINDKQWTLRDVLREIARGYMEGTPNGIKMDAASGLIWSPSHFTWMDTNYPAGTPREGYPVEIQALWIRLLDLLTRLEVPPVDRSWSELAELARRSVSVYFWMEDLGYFADCLVAKAGVPARTSPPDDALRPNCLFLVSLGLVTGERARRTVEAAARHLVVPGAIRSLAPLRVNLPLPIRGGDGGLLNDPYSPYWGFYQGDEDTRRKPAYHNGTAWVWPFPTFCEALAMAHEQSREAVAAALAYLRSAEGLMDAGCVGHLPEVLDGDAPHAQRGCDAQAWSVSEVLRVWRKLGGQG